MPILRNEHLFLALNVEPDARMATLASLWELLTKPEAHTQIAQIIERESTLASSLLRLTHSRYFKKDQPFKTLQKAATELGSTAFIKLALLSLALPDLQQDFKPYPMPPEHLQKMAFLTASAMTAAAPKANLHPLQAYALGLFHGFGRCVLNRFIASQDPAMRATQTDYFALSHWERKHIGMSHAAAGAVLWVKWGFPESFYRPIQFQNRPQDAGSQHASSTALLHLCLRIANNIIIPDKSFNPLKIIPPETFASAGIAWQRFKSLEGPANMGLLQIQSILSQLPVETS